MSAAPFTPGDLVVYRVGTGASLSGNATATFLDEYTTAGALVQSIPISASGATALTSSGTSPSEGQLTLSPDGTTIALTGYNVAAGGATQGTDNGTVALVGASASPAYYIFPSASVVNGNNIRTATVDGNKLYIAGAATGVQYAGVSSLTSGGAVNAATTKLNTVAKNIEDLQIFNGQLYFSTEKQSGYSIGGDSIASLGTGEPTSTAAAAGIADSSVNSSSFFFEHLGGGSGTANTLYVADSSVGIEKYSLIGSTWTAEGNAAVNGGAFGITGTVDSSGYVHVYATNALGIYTITDSSGQTGTLAGSATQMVTARVGTTIDGIDPAPDDGVGAITGVTATATYIQGRPAMIPAGAAVFSDASNLDGAKLVVSGGLTNDIVAILSNGTITTSGSVVSYGGIQVGNVSGGANGTPLTITFNSVGGIPVTSGQVQSLIQQIAFSSTTASTPGNRTLSIQMTENNGATDLPATQVVTVAAPAVNAPLINSLGSLNIGQNAGQQSISLSGIQHNGGSGVITVTAISDSPSLIPDNGNGAVAVVYTSPGSTGSLTFTSASGASGVVHLIVTVSDSAGSAVAVETVTVIGPPTCAVSGPLNVVENNPLVFTSTSGDGLSIADFAVGTNTMQLALSAGHGTLTLGATAGVSFTSGTNGQSSFTVTGTIASINAALTGLSYSPTNGFTGVDSLQMVSSDLGHTALGGVQTATSSVSLNVINTPPAVLLNEIESNEPGTDDDRYEYVELNGTPAASLNNLYFVAFGGSAGTIGVADYAINLSNYYMGSDGLLVIQSAASSGHSIPTATTVVPDSNYFTITGGFPNGTLSFFLYESPNAAFVSGTDYDTNSDGTLDHVPAGAVAVDSVAIPDTTNSNDITYSNAQVTELATLNKGTVDAITRFPNTTVTASGAWYGGELIDTNNVDSQIDYDPNREAVNEPANAYLTPGSVNYPEYPVFNQAGYSFTVPKTAGAGTLVGTAAATAGGTDTLSYSLSGTGSSNFVISSSGGSIIVANGASLSGSNYNLTVTAKDSQNGYVDTVPLTVTLSLIATTVTLGTSNETVSYGQPVTFTATVAISSGSNETGSVQFLIDGNAENPIGLVGNAATLTTSALDAGTHTITAVYSGDSNFNPSTSTSLNQMVTAVPLQLNGSAFYLKLDANQVDLDIWTNTTGTGAFSTQPLSDVQSISVQGTSGSDSLVVDFSNGDPLPGAGLSDTGGGSGSGDQLLVIGSEGNDAVTASAGQIVMNGTVITLSNVGQATFTPGSGVDSLSVNSGVLALAARGNATGITAMNFSSISLSTGAKLLVDSPVSSAKRVVLVTAGLSLSQSAGTFSSSLDMTANDLIVRGGDLTAIRAYLTSGLFSASASGVTSSTALGSASQLTTLGVIQNSADGTPTGVALYSVGTDLGVFDGVNTLNTDVLVKYTYYGDTNLSGATDGSDYSRLDNGYSKVLSGWFNGDFNYDRTIDGSDYTLMDNAFNRQASSLAAIAAAQIRGTKPDLQPGGSAKAHQPLSSPTAAFFQVILPITFAQNGPGVQQLLERSDILSALNIAAC